MSLLRLTISFFVLGLSFGSGPCLVSCGPLLFSYMAGSNKNIYQSIKGYVIFSLSKASVYLVTGLLFFIFGKLAVDLLSNSRGVVYSVSGVFIVSIGLLLLLRSRKDRPLCPKIQDALINKDNKTFATFGILTGILPCAPLLVVFSSLGLIAKNWVEALVLSLSFGLGTSISALVILALLAGYIPQKIKHSERIFNLIGGLVVIILGFYIIKKAF